MKIPSIALALLGVALGSLPGAGAQERTPDQLLTPSSLATSIVTGAPGSDALLIQAEAAGLSLMPGANLPDPEVEGELLGGPSGVKPRWNAGVSWSLDWPGVYAARSKQAKAEAEVLRYEAYAEILNRSADVRVLLINMIHDLAAISTLREIDADNREMMTYVRKGQQQGQLTRLDVSKLEIEQARIQSRISELLSDFDESVATLNGQYAARLDSVALAAMHYDTPSLMPFEVYEENVRASLPMALLQAKTEVAKSALTTSGRERLPGIGIGYVHAYEDGNHFNGGSLSVSIPIFSAKDKAKAAEAELFSAESIQATEEDAAIAALRLRYARAAKMKQRLDALASSLLDDNPTELMHKAYLGGQWSLLQYLQERAYFLEARLDYLSLERDMQLALSELVRGLR